MAMSPFKTQGATDAIWHDLCTGRQVSEVGIGRRVRPELPRAREIKGTQGRFGHRTKRFRQCVSRSVCPWRRVVHLLDRIIWGLHGENVSRLQVQLFGC